MKASRRLITGLFLFALLLCLAVIWPGRRPAGLQTASSPVPQQAGDPAGEQASQPAAPSVPRPAEFASIAPWSNWLEAYRTAGTPQAKAVLLSEGVKLAETRRVEMMQLIKTDPEQALAQALPYAVRQQLPPEVAALIEQPVSGRGELRILCDSRSPGHQHDGTSEKYLVTMGRVSYQTFTYGQRLTEPSHPGGYLHGIAIAQDAAGHVAEVSGTTLPPLLALSADAVRFLNADEAAARLRDDPAAAAQGKSILVQHGDKYFAFAKLAQAQAFNRRLQAANAQVWASGGFTPASHATDQLPPPNASGTQGLKKLLYIRVTFADDPVIPESDDAAQATVRANNEYFNEGSYNTVWWESTVTPVVRLPQRKNFYGEAPNLLLNDAAAGAAALGYFASDYYSPYYVLHNTLVQYDFGGLSSGFLNASPGALTHELGHNFGLPHANLFQPEGRLPPPIQPTNPPAIYPIDPDSVIGHNDINAPYILRLAGDEPVLEYGNQHDVMGSGGGHFSALFKHYMHWLPRPFVKFVGASTTNRIFAFDTPFITDGRLYALRIPKDVNREYWLSYRQGIPGNPWFSSGLEVEWNLGGVTAGRERLLGNNVLIDTTPGTTFGKQDAALIVGKTMSDPAASLYVTPVAIGGGPEGSDKWIDVVVQVGPFPANQTPTFTLSASATTVSNGATVLFTADAQDPDGDQVAFHWDFGDYTFGTNGPVQSKTFTEDGRYVVRCEVSDMKGGLTAAYVVITVGSPATFTMSGRVLDLFGNPLQGVRVHNSGVKPASPPAAPSGISTNAPIGTYRYAYTDRDGYYVIANVPPGTYTNRAFIYGYRTEPLDFADPVNLINGNANNLNFTATPLTRVRIEEILDAEEAGGDGTFRIIREGDFSRDLNVRFQVSGSAVLGADYTLAPITFQTNITFTTNMGVVTTNFTLVPGLASITIPAGLDSTELYVSPIDNGAGSGRQSVVLTLLLQTNEIRVTTVLTNILTTNDMIVITNTLIVQRTNQVRIPGWEVRNVGPDSTPTWFQTDPTYVLHRAEATLFINDDEMVPATPTVGLLLLDPDAAESREDSATVLFYREGAPLDTDLTITYRITGEAENGVDFLNLPGAITIPAGEEFVLLPILAVNDLFVEGNEEFSITVVTNAQSLTNLQYRYQGAGASADFILVDDDLPLVNVFASDSTVNRSGGSARVTFSRAGSLTEALLVNYLVGGTAVSGVDYQTLAGSVIIPANQLSVDVPITPISASTNRLPRTVTVLVSDATTYNVFNQNAATVTIIDDTLPTVTLEVVTTTAAESGAPGVFRVTRTGSTTNSLNVFFDVGGSAWEGSDYSAIGTNIVIPAGALTATINITPLQDFFRELGDVTGEDTVILSLRAGTNYLVGSPRNGTITITDDDPNALPSVGFMLRNSTIREDEAFAVLWLKVSANPATNRPIQLEYRVTGGSAVVDVNYSIDTGIGRTGILDIVHYTPPNPPPMFFSFENGIYGVPVLLFNDGLATGNKTVTVTLFNPSRYQTNISFATNTMGQRLTNTVITPIPTNFFLGDARSHTLTILDVGATTVSVAASATHAYEAGPVPAQFIITRTSPNTNQPLVVPFMVTGTAASGNDFIPLGTNGTVTIPAGTNSVSVNVIPLDDPTEEVAESVILTLLPKAGYQIGASTASLLLVSDDGTLQFTASTWREDENGGTALLTVQRTGDTNRTTTVDYFTRDGTATAGADYSSTNATLTFAPGETLRTISISLMDDVLVEAAETISIVLTNPTGGIPLGGQNVATLFIDNDDTSIAFATNSWITNAFRAAENAGSATIVLTRNGLTNGTTTVDFLTTNGAAFAGSDYTDTRLTVTFAPGATNAFVTVPLIDDFAFEGDQGVNLQLSNPGPNASLASPSSATLMIADDECSVEFSEVNFDVNEYAGNAFVTVRRNGGTVNTVTVNYQSFSGTASNILDYNNVSGALTFAGDAYVLNTNGTGELLLQPGAREQTIVIPIRDDVLGEGDEIFNLTLSSLAGPVVGATTYGTITNATVTIRDNESPGHVDYEYDPGLGANARVRSVALQQDQRVVFGGDFTLVGGLSLNRVARLATTGVVDPSFNPGAGADASIYVVAVQPNDRILIGGLFTTVDGTSRNRLARLTADGNLDLSFNPGSGPNNLVRAIAVQADGKILIGGDFNLVNGTSRSFVARLNADGSLDTSFTAALNSSVNALAVQADGKILVGGAFTTASGASRNRIARLATNGVNDATFTPGLGADSAVNSLALQADGQVVIGGAFTHVNGLLRNYLARLDTTGALDSSFNAGAGPDATVHTVASGPGGKLVVGGDFVVFNGVSRSYFTRLLADGSVDNSFNIGTGANDPVLTAVVQTNTSVVIGGDFTVVRDLPRPRIARLHGNERSTVPIVDFASASFTVAENGGTALITLLRSGSTNQAFTVRYATTNGTATAGLDYLGATNTLSFAAGQLSNTFSLFITNDTLVEGEETILLSFTNVTAGIDVSGQSTAVLTILDDERFVQFASTNFNAREDSTNAQVTLTRTGGLTGTLRVTLLTSDGTALAPTDYTTTSNQVTFAAGQTTATVLIPVTDDFNGELAERFNVSLSLPVDGALGAPATATVTVLDNDINYGTFHSTNAGAIVILDGNPAVPYPSMIVVSNLTGVVTKVVVTLAGLRHTFPSDLDVLLVGPGGETCLLMSDAGGGGDLFGINLRFDDAATTVLSEAGPLLTSTNRPTDYGSGDTFPAPAPAAPYGARLDAFHGTAPNGTWSLYVLDDRGADFGTVSNGWRLTLTTVDPATSSDLDLAMAAAPDPIAAGDTLTYSIAVTNRGPLDVTSVALTNRLPANAEFLSATSSQGACTNVNGLVTCALGDVSVNGGATVSITVRPLVAGLLTNTATVAASEPDVLTTNNTATVLANVTPGVTADLRVTLTAVPATVFASGLVTNRFTVTNFGPLSATGVLVTNRLPANGDFVSAAVTQGTFVNHGAELVFQAGTLANGAGLAGIVVVRARSEGVLTNTVTARAQQADFSPANTATTLTPVEPAADLVVVIADSRDPVGVGANLIYTVTVFNNGPSDAAEVTLFDTLPPQFTLVSASASQGVATAGGGVVLFNFGTLTNGRSASGTLVVRPVLSGTFTNRATVVAAVTERSPADNTATEATTVSLGGATVALGIIDNGVVQLGVHPAGHLNVEGGQPSLSGTTFVGLRYLPTLAESTAPGCLCEGWGVADALSGISGGANESSDFGTFGLVVESFTADGVSATSVVRVDGPGSPRRIFGGTNGAAPTFRVTHYYHPSPVTTNLYQVDVTIENISSNVVEALYRRVMDWDIEPTAFREYSTILKGDSTNLVYTSDDGFASGDPLTGPSQILTNGTFIDSGPADHGALFDFNFGQLAPGATTSFITYYGAAATERDAITAIARVGAEAFSFGQPSGPGGATNGSPNTFIFAFGGIGGSALAGADVRVLNTTPNPLVALGSLLTYTIQVTNAGPDTATDVMLTDTLPPTLTVTGVSASSGVLSTNGNVLTLALGSLGAGASATLVVAGLPTEEGALTNLAVVTTTQIDFAEGNNRAERVVSVVAAGTYANPSPIQIYDAAPAVGYPSVIHVEGAPPALASVRVTLTELNHSYPADLDILLVGPQGQSVVLMSDMGLGFDLNGVTLVFDDAATNALPAAGAIVAGVYVPGNVGGVDGFYPPAPGGSYGATLAVFERSNANGDWLLYIMDDQGADSGVLGGGWQLGFTFVEGVALDIVRMGTSVVLSWDGSETGYLVEVSADVGPGAVWSAVGGPGPALVSGRWTQTLPLGAGAEFFRLSRP